MGRVLTATDAEGNTTSITYDADGNAVEKYDAYGTPVQENTYDALDRLTETTDALGKVTAYTYNSFGSVETMTEGTAETIERTTTYGYTKEGRLSSATDPLMGVTACTYDSRGNLGSVTDPMEGTTNYTYDAINRLTAEKTVGAAEKEYTYNAEGLLKEKKEADVKTAYTYDALGRITKITDPLGTVEYTYDKNGNITEVKDKSGTTRRTYDQMNRVKTCTDCNGNTISYAYDKLGNRTSITYPGGETVAYTYYKTGKLKTATDARGGTTRYEYDKNNRLTKVTRPDGSTEQYARRPDGLTEKQTDKTAGGAIIHEYGYGYDIYGNITKITGSGQPQAAPATGTRMEYGEDNRLETYNGEPVTYDARGNMTHGPLNGRMADYTYDCRNRLIKVTEEDGTTTEYEYDAENTRTAKIKNGVKTIYVTDKEAEYSQVLQETEYTYSRLTGTGRKLSVKTYTYGAGLISEHRSGQDGAETLYYHYDHLGSTTAVTDKTGKIVYRFAYDTYGELAAVMDAAGTTLIQAQTGKTVQECMNQAVSETGIRFLYNGKNGVITGENGLYYMRARYYNTDIKRFINRDVVDGSMENSQSLNKYSYVQGNPVNLTDPFGLSPVGGNGDDGGGGGGNNDDDDGGSWLKNKWDDLDPGIKHIIKSLIPGYGAYMQFAEAEEYRERGDYFNAVRSATGGLANVALTLGIVVALGIAAPIVGMVAMVTSAVVLCVDVATSCYQYGNRVGNAINELLEAGGISLATMEGVREAETQAKVSLFFGILGAGAIDSYLAKATTATGVAGSRGGTSTLAQYGDDFGKMGTYVENPNIKVDWTQYAEHAAERMQQRGMTQEMVNNIVENGKVLSQNSGNKFAYITQEGVAIVSKEGKLITSWSSTDFDSSMLKIINKLFGE